MNSEHEMGARESDNGRRAAPDDVNGLLYQIVKRKGVKFVTLDGVRSTNIGKNEGVLVVKLPQTASIVQSMPFPWGGELFRAKQKTGSR